MSIEIMNRVMECDAFAESSHKFVLLILANCANAEGFCYPSRGYIARMTQLHADTVARAIERLKSDGHLTENKREGKNSTFLVHPVITEKNDTPRMVRGVRKEPAHDVQKAMKELDEVQAQRVSCASSPTSPPALSGAALEGGQPKELSTDPPHGAGGRCGQSIHNPPHGAATPPAPCGDTPRTMRDEPSERRLRTSEAPDDKKNPQDRNADRKPEASSVGRRRLIHEPTAQELEAARTQQMQRIDAALKRKAAG